MTNVPGKLDDIVADYGYLTLGARLKRLGERLQNGVQMAIDAEALPVTAAQYPMLAVLDRDGESTITHLVERLGVSQPGVTRMVRTLETAGLVRSVPDAGDARVRRIALTGNGRNLIAVSRAGIWPIIEEAVRELCSHDTMASDILQTIDFVERSYAEEALFDRMQRLNRQRRERDRPGALAALDESKP